VAAEGGDPAALARLAAPHLTLPMDQLWARMMELLYPQAVAHWSAVKARWEAEDDKMGGGGGGGGGAGGDGKGGRKGICTRGPRI
jgi:hypothetical protein